MKRVWIVFLALLLAGCAGQEPPQETETIGTTAAVQTGWYDPDSLLEQQTEGSVRVYPLEGDGYTGFAFVGDKVLVVNENGGLVLLVGEQGIPAATVKTNTSLNPGGLGFDTSKTGAAYYSEKNNEVFMLNPLLQQTGRVQLPEDLEQPPVISLAQNEVYYCVGENIMAQNMESGITRLVKQQSCQSQRLVDSYFEGKLLACELIDPNGQEQTLYISSETGQTMSRDDGIFYLDTYQEQFVALRMDITVLQQIVGKSDGTCEALYIPEDYGTFYSALPMNGVLTCLDTKNGQKLAFYDRDSGEKTSEVMLTGVEIPVAVQADEQYIWILAADRATGKQALYRWEMKAQKYQGSYLRPLYTAQAPDTDGIALCQEHVDWCNTQYGVRITIWEDALNYTGGYTVTPEHQPAVITQMLTQLEELLPQFPEDFLRKTVESGWIRIGLVRSIASGESWTCFWEDGDCCILITPQADVLVAFLRGVGHGVDSHILGNSRIYDEWEKRNPPNFVYGEECDHRYLEGKYRYFTDEFATQSVLEDRSRLFAAAMDEETGEIFSAKGMQKKLRFMCEGIREAYGLEKAAQEFLWEQHLDTPLYDTETK